MPSIMVNRDAQTAGFAAWLAARYLRSSVKERMR